ncbi:MAG: hypothetical protein E6Q97_00065 [Desulfurellales bacterium]|nr:MAG: hypothetical protein E6Q97_00065 [Desulfurellales bacterium]
MMPPYVSPNGAASAADIQARMDALRRLGAQDSLLGRGLQAHRDLLLKRDQWRQDLRTGAMDAVGLDEELRTKFAAAVARSPVGELRAMRDGLKQTRNDARNALSDQVANGLGLGGLGAKLEAL